VTTVTSGAYVISYQRVVDKEAGGDEKLSLHKELH
jgi:hypothetical protein